MDAYCVRPMPDSSSWHVTGYTNVSLGPIVAFFLAQHSPEASHGSIEREPD